MGNVGQLIVSGMRECVFVRTGHEYSLVVVCDESWKRSEPVPDAGQVMLYRMSPSTACVWALLKTCPEKKGLVRALSAKTGLSPEMFKDPLDSLLKRFEDHFLIAYAEPSADPRSAYQLMLGGEEISMDTVTFDKDDLSLEPFIYAQEAFCDCSSDPTAGGSPGGPSVSCIVCDSCVVC
jgi:hypothetical protein